MTTANPTSFDSATPSSPAPSAARSTDAPADGSAFRLWPGPLIVALQWLIIVVPGQIAPLTMMQFMGWFLGPVVGTIGLLIWWLFASRAPRVGRWTVVLVFLISAIGALLASHPTIGIFGIVIYALPIANTALVAWLALTPTLNWNARRTGLLVVTVLAWFWIDGLRMKGTTGNITAEFVFRWIPTAEERYLAELANGKGLDNGKVVPVATPAQPAKLELSDGDWPAFRGAQRDGRLTGVKINADWAAHPPKLLWKHHVGPSWSSFSVVGSHVYTQEQRGENELVICYDAATGAEIWTHADPVRFMETMAGPGPRATPTFFDGRLYVQGATGKLNCLDALTGNAIWTRDVAADSGAKIPQWGFSSSPLIADGIVAVFVGGPSGKSVMGFDIEKGEPKWSGGDGTQSYCSLQSVKLCGVDQAVIATDRGISSYAMKTGTVLWQHKWVIPGMSRVVQPAVVNDTDLLLGTGFGMGTQRVRVKHDGDAWTTDVVWKTTAIKPYYNDLVIHHDYLYGFDGNILTCVKLDDGSSVWRTTGYGNGQLILLADQDLLLILSEKGEIALVDAKPGSYVERGKIPGIEGKSWNHPVVAHGKLFVRNGEEAACFDVSEVAPGK